MNKQIVITEATPEDAKAITYVRHKTWLMTYPNEKEGITKEDIEASFNKRSVEDESEQRAHRIKNDITVHLWIAKEESIVVGFIEVRKDSNYNIIHALYVHPDYQQQGVGTALMNEALVWLGDEKEIICHVASYNEAAIGFYKQFGFRENGSIKHDMVRLASGKEIPILVMIRLIV